MPKLLPCLDRPAVGPCLVLLLRAENRGLDRRGAAFTEKRPYFIQGVCYHPVPVGEELRSFESLTQDLSILQDLGRQHHPGLRAHRLRAVLDEIHAAGLSVILGFGYDQGGVFDLKSGHLPRLRPAVQVPPGHPVLGAGQRVQLPPRVVRQIPRRLVRNAEDRVRRHSGGRPPPPRLHGPRRSTR